MYPESEKCVSKVDDVGKVILFSELASMALVIMSGFSMDVILCKHAESKDKVTDKTNADG